MLFNHYSKKIAGFTLVELVAVIVILGFISLIGTKIVITIVEGQVTAAAQTTLLLDAQLATDRMKKQLRQSLPNSLRISNNNQCVSYLPVVASGFYLDNLPDNLNGLPAEGRTRPLSVSPYSISGGNAVYISIGADSEDEIFGSTASSLVLVSSFTDTTITLNQDHRWERNSPSQSFFLAEHPQAFCAVNNELRFYPRVSQNSNQVNLTRDYDVMALDVDLSNPIFTVNDPSSCSKCLDINLLFSKGDAQVLKQLRVASYYEL